jgi:flagella basal body P-ring formation protein FlgA
MPSTASTANPSALANILAHAVADDQPIDTSVSFPPALERAIVNDLAEQWNARTQDISLHWGVVRDPKLIDQVTNYRLVGKGVNGWFAVLFDCDDRPAFAVRLRVGVRRSVMLALRDLEEGHTLRESDFTTDERLTWGPPSEIAVPPAAGWRVVAAIRAGEVLAEPQVMAAPVVLRGDRVKLTWQRGVVTVTLEGIAECDAAAGHCVAVRLRGRRGTRRGTVTGPGRAYLAS